MTEQQIQEFMKLLQGFCNENMGNRMNQWLAESFLNRTYKKLKEMSEVQIAPNDAKK